MVHSVLAFVISKQRETIPITKTRPEERQTMNKVKRSFLLNALKLFDLGLIVASFGLATFLLVHTDQSASLQNFLAMRVKLSNCAIFAFALFLCHGMFSLCGLYQSRRLSNRLAETMDVLKATTLATLCMALIAAVLRDAAVPRMVGGGHLSDCLRAADPHL